MRMKTIGNILYSLNFLQLIVVVVHTFLFAKYGYNFSLGDGKITNDLFYNVRGILVIPILGFIIYCIYVWDKKDKKTSRILLLIFLPGVYTLFYYPFILRNGWV